MAKLRDTATGCAIGVVSILALGCICWLYFTDLVLSDYETGDRGLGTLGDLGMPGVCIAWATSIAGSLGLTFRRYERLSIFATVAPIIYLLMFSVALMARWCKPMWRLV